MLSADWILLISIIALLSLLWFIARGYRQADWGHPLTNTIDGLLRLFLRVYHRFDGPTIALPEQGGVILVSNHISGLDPFLLIAACRRPIRFLIAREQYERFGLRWLFRLAGCIPVERNGRTETSYRAALRALQQGEVVALFPGGGIHTEQQPAPVLKRGFVRLAKASAAAVYPVHLTGVRGQGHVIRSVLIPGQPQLTVYPPVCCSETPEQACLQKFAELLNKTHPQTT